MASSSSHRCVHGSRQEPLTCWVTEVQPAHPCASCAAKQGARVHCVAGRMWRSECFALLLRLQGIGCIWGMALLFSPGGAEGFDWFSAECLRLCAQEDAVFLGISRCLAVSAACFVLCWIDFIFTAYATARVRAHTRLEKGCDAGTSVTRHAAGAHCPVLCLECVECVCVAREEDLLLSYCALYCILLFP